MVAYARTEEQKKYLGLRKLVLAYYKADANPKKEKAARFLFDHLLVYDQVPSNCLFMLKNYFEGKEERIFIDEGGKQVGG